MLCRPQAATLRAVPGNFGGTPGTLEDSCLSVREDMVGSSTELENLYALPAFWFSDLVLSVSVEANTCQGASVCFLSVSLFVKV